MSRQVMMGAAVALCLAGWPTMARAQVLTEQDVVQTMSDPGFQQALGGCFVSGDRPPQLTLTLVLDPQGGAELSEASGELDAARRACVGQAVALLSFPATGGSFMITLTVPVMEVEAPAGGDKPKFQVKPIEAPAKPVTAVVPVTPAPPPPKSMGMAGWQTAYSKARGQIIGGAVTLGASFLILFSPGLSLLATSPIMCDRSTTSFYGYSICRSWVGAGIALGLLGAVGMSIGIAVLNKGIKRRRLLLEQKMYVAVTPGPGAGLSAVWTF